MKKIEITTAQNVTIQYTLGTLWERALALMIDVAILFFSVLILRLLFITVEGPVADLLVYVVLVPIVVLYSLAFEVLNNGRSPGKLALKLAVVRMDGRGAGFLDYLMRWSFRLVDIYFSFGTVAAICVVSTRFSQRIGDLLANTVVVKTGKSDRLPLRTLVNLEKTATHKVTYAQAGRLTERVALIIKETLERQITVGNAAHEKALTVLSQKLQRELRVRDIKDHRAFLQTVLSDYVVMTR